MSSMNGRETGQRRSLARLFHRRPRHTSGTSASTTSLAIDDNSTVSPSINQKAWLNLKFQSKEPNRIKRPHELQSEMESPPISTDPKVLNKIRGSLFALAIGDALGAAVEFRPREFLKQHPVSDYQGGGTWNLAKGQFTDDTSMALCLAISLIVRGGFSAYDQLVRYKWWFQHGYMSSTGECFDIGAATRDSIEEFRRRQQEFSRINSDHKCEDLDFISDLTLMQSFDCSCSRDNVAGNGALMRLAPVPLFFYRYPEKAVQYSGESGRITHGDIRASDACRYYGALIVGALRGYPKDYLLGKQFYNEIKDWMGSSKLCADVKKIAKGSYKLKKGYEDGIRGKGYIINALEAALWAFYNDKGSFETGVLLAVNLGDDTDTTAAIYGQLAGACYGYECLKESWKEELYAKEFIENISQWLCYESNRWKPLNKLYTIKNEMMNNMVQFRSVATVPRSLRQTLSSDSGSTQLQAKTSNEQERTTLLFKTEVQHTPIKFALQPADVFPYSENQENEQQERSIHMPFISPVVAGVRNPVISPDRFTSTTTFCPPQRKGMATSFRY